MAGVAVERSLAADYTPPSLRAWQRSHEGHLTIEWTETARVQQKKQGDRLVLRFTTPLRMDIEPVLRNISNFVYSDRTIIEGRDLSLALRPGVFTKVKVREKRIVTVEFSLDAAQEPLARVKASTIDNGVRLALDWPGPTAVKANKEADKLRLEIVPPRDFNLTELAELQQTLRPWFDELGSEAGSDLTTLSLTLEPQIAASIRSDGTARTVIDLIRNASTRATPLRQSKKTFFIPARKPLPPSRVAQAQETTSPIPKRRPSQTSEQATNTSTDTKVIVAKSADKNPPKTLILDWKKPVAAAIFLRAGYLWAIFDETDASLLAGLPTSPSSFGPGAFVPAEGGTALRFPLLKPVHVNVSQTAEGRWQIEPTSSSSTPKSLTIGRIDGSTSLRVSSVSGERIVGVVDPLVGDQLDILPLREIGIGQPIRRRFVDLELLPTSQGLVWRRFNHQLVASVDNEDLKFSSPEGLLLSPIVPDSSKASEPTIMEAMATKDLASNQSRKDQVERPAVKPVETEQAPKLVAARPSSFFDLAGSGVERELVNEYRRIRRQAITRASPEHRDHARLRLARLLVAERLANEARTILSTISDEADDHIILQKKALTAVSALFTGHLNEAKSLLHDPGLNDDDEIDLWRAALDSTEDNWLPAAERWRATSDVLDKYPPRLKLDLGLMALRAAIETDDDKMMRTGLRRLTRLPLDPYDQARVDAMKALKAERAGDLEKARALLTNLATNPNQTIRTLADFQLASIELKTNGNNPALLQSLDRRIPIWRGHPEEQSMLDKLARRYKDANALREALTTWRRLIRLFPATAENEDLQRARQETFVQALANMTEPKIDRLDVYAIYLDFIGLVPDQPEARDLYRHLARHLKELDLLDETIDVLQSLFTSTDDDLERSELAAEVAELMLQQQRPTPALAVLDGSKSARTSLPTNLNEERQMIRARALARLKRTDEALQALRDLLSDPARRLQAKILWDDRRWPRLSAVVESYFIDADPTSPLTDDEQEMVLWLALAHQRENAQEKLNELRKRFTAEMQGGPFAEAFDVATQSNANVSDVKALLVATRNQLAELQRFRQAIRALP